MDQMLEVGLPPVMRLGGTGLRLVGRARVYTCGDHPLRRDASRPRRDLCLGRTLARALHACGAEVIVCRNVTDVDDVPLAAAGRAGKPYDRFAAIQQFYFDRDMTGAGGGPPAISNRGRTSYVAQVIALAAGLLARDPPTSGWPGVLPRRHRRAAAVPDQGRRGGSRPSTVTTRGPA